MGFWNDGIRSRSPSPSRSHYSTSSTKKHHSSSYQDQQQQQQHRSSSHGDHSHNTHQHQSTTSSTRPGPYPTSGPSYARSVSSFFGGGGGGRTSPGRRASSTYSSSSRARPRSGLMAKLRKFLRDLYQYMQRHPVKVFMLVIMPLLTGGALTKILSRFGVRLPRSVENMFGGSRGLGGGGGVTRERERFYARGGARDFGGGTALPGMQGVGGGGGIGDSVQGALKIAKMFM